MRRRHREQLFDHLHAIEDRIRTVEVATLISGPNNPVVADAYNGLRQQIVMAAAERRTHLAQLAQFASAIDDGATQDELGLLVKEWMSQHGLISVAPQTHPDAYEIRGKGSVLTTRKRAFVDEKSGAVISVGHAVASDRRIEKPTITRGLEPPPTPSETQDLFPAGDVDGNHPADDTESQHVPERSFVDTDQPHPESE